MTFTIYDEFAGWGGSSQGMTAVPGTELMLAANHDQLAVEVHALNFPRADHYRGDIAKADIGRFPRADIFWSSPACPAWSDARGVKRDFDRSTHGVLFDDEFGPINTDPNVARSRALMEEVPRYLGAMRLRGQPVLCGVVENVIQCRKWDQWHRWIREIRGHGYRTRVIALNSMHVNPVRAARAPQSRDRLYVAYWLESLGRDPDWNKWLRPPAWCPTCKQTVAAMQVFKKPSNDMGRYGVRHGQYVYRCPHVACRNQIIEPWVLPAAAAIDWTLPPGAKIGERVTAKGRPDPLEPATLARIQAGLTRFAARPMLSPAGGTWRDAATSVEVPMPTRTTRETDALVCPPLLVPTTGRTGKNARPVGEPLPTQTCRRELGVAIPPFLAMLRGGGCKQRTRGIDEPLDTFAASGTHHGLVQPAGSTATRWGDLLVPYYSNGKPRPVHQPVGTLTTKDRYALLGVTEVPDVNECTFRMLEPAEIGAGMAFAPDYKVLGDKRDRVSGYGRAVTPPAAEVLVSALVEAITGEDLPREAVNAA